ncbi:hypothetical protein V1524DRAFT_369208, partial [Lipomyces starkeyi]
VLDDLSLDESEELVLPDSTSCESDTDDSDIEGNDSSTISSGSNRRRKQKKKHGEKSEKNGKSLNPLLREYIDQPKAIIKKKSDALGWCHPPDVYSEWQSESMNSLSPAPCYLPKVFYWIPHQARGVKLYCPTCRAEGKSRPLAEKGWGNDPRRVTDIDQNWYLYSRQYVCKKDYSHHGCGKRFWGSLLLDVLPAGLRGQFPAFLTRRSGISLEVARMLRISFSSGMGPAPLRSMIEQLHRARYDRLRHVSIETFKQLKEEARLQQIQVEKPIPVLFPCSY